MSFYYVSGDSGKINKMVQEAEDRKKQMEKNINFTEGCLQKNLLDSCISKNDRIAMENNFDCINSGEWHHNNIENQEVVIKFFCFL